MAMAQGKAGQAARAAASKARSAAKSGISSSVSGGSSSKGSSYTAPKSTTGTKYSFNIGGKTVNLTSDQLSKLAPESKNALMSKYKTGEASYTMDSGETPAPALKAFEGKAADLVKQAYNKAVQAGTGSEFLKTTGAALKAKGYDLESSLGLGVDKDIADANTPIKPAIPIKTDIDTTPVLATNKTDLSRINATNAKAQLAAGKITQEQYNDVMTGKAGAGITPPTITPTEQITPTDNTQQIDLGNLGKFGADAAAENAANNSFIDTRNQKIIAGLGETAKDPAAVKAYLESQPGFKNASLADQQNTINNIVQKAGGEVGGDTPLGESELPAVNDMMAMAREWNERDVKNYEEGYQNAMNMRTQYQDRMANDTFNVMDSAVKQRFQAMGDNFSNIYDSINKLEDTANSLFDVNKMIARQNQAKQLADSGILTGEQAASAASYSLQDYTMNVELQRAEIAKQMQEQMTNALKEKTSMEDQIIQQKGIDAVTKQGMLDNVTKMYLDIDSQYRTNLDNANRKMDELITNAQNTNIQVDMMAKGPLIQEKANQDLIGQKLQQANTNAGYRYQYVVDTLTNVAPTLASKAMALMGQDQKNGTFLKQDANQYVSSLISRLQSTGTATPPPASSGGYTPAITVQVPGADASDDEILNFLNS